MLERMSGLKRTPTGLTDPQVRQPVDRRRFLALFSAVMLPMFLAAVDQTIVATATPVIGQDLGHLSELSWLAVSYLLSALIVVPLYGQAGDHFGRRRVLGFAVLLFTVGSLACGLAPSFHLLVAARVLQGLGGGGLMSLSQALIGEVLPPQERARYQGWFAIVFVSASLLGPVLGAVIVAQAGWRWLFLVNVPLALYGWWRLQTLDGAQDRLRPWQGRFDWSGTGLFAVAVVATSWALSEGGRAFGWVSPMAAAGLTVLVLLWWAVWQVERSVVAASRTPFLPVDVIALPALRVSLGVVFGFAAVMFASVFYLPAYLQLAFAGPVSESALLLLPLTGGMVLGAGLTGRLIVRTGRTRDFPVAGMSLAAAALAAIALLPPGRTGLMLLSFLAGAGLGTVMSVMQIITQIAAGPARLGAAAASVSLGRSLGASVGASVFGAVVFGGHALPDLAAVRADPAALAITLRAFHIGFGGAAVVALATALLATRLPPIRLPAGGRGGEPSLAD